MRAERVKSRSMTLPCRHRGEANVQFQSIHNPALGGGYSASCSDRLPSGGKNVPIAQNAVCASGPVWKAQKFTSTRIQSPDHPACRPARVYIYKIYTYTYARLRARTHIHTHTCTHTHKQIHTHGEDIKLCFFRSAKDIIYFSLFPT